MVRSLWPNGPDGKDFFDIPRVPKNPRPSTADTMEFLAVAATLNEHRGLAGGISRSRAEKRVRSR